MTAPLRSNARRTGTLGISLLLLERSMPGIKTKQMNCQGVWASGKLFEFLIYILGTTYITFEDVMG